MYSNEDLATAIQDGDESKAETLWFQVKAFIAKQARRYLLELNNNPCGLELDDLIQSGYFAMLSAAKTYDPNGGGSFLTWLVFRLLTEFGRAAGLKHYTDEDGKQHKRRSVLDNAINLDQPVSDEPDAATIGDLILGSTVEIDEAERRVYIQQLHNAIEKLLAEIPADEARLIRQLYYNGLSVRAVAERNGTSEADERRRKSAAFRNLQRKAQSTQPGRELRRYLDENTNFYKSVGVNSFNKTHTSAVEYNVLKRERLEKWNSNGTYSPQNPV